MVYSIVHCTLHLWHRTRWPRKLRRDFSVKLNPSIAACIVEYVQWSGPTFQCKNYVMLPSKETDLFSGESRKETFDEGHNVT